MAQSEKRENSVLFALRDLRQIEESRVQEEELAVRSAEEARRLAQEQAERQRREEEEARVRAERDHQQRIEDARHGAEREARMRVESAEAAERNRIQGELDAQRLAQEMDLRRAEVAKKRPTWMLVVTGLALVAAVALVWFAIQKASESSQSEEDKIAAQKKADEADKVAKDAAVRVAQLESDLKVMAKQIDDATTALENAQNDADRSKARAELDKLRQQRADMERRAADAKAAAEHRERMKGIKDTCQGVLCK
jgi:hypothetical protein